MKNGQFGTALKKLRKQNHLTQRQLGHRLGVSDKAISRWEAGDTAPDLDMLRTIATVFGVSTDRLLEIKPLPLQAIIPFREAPAYGAPAPEELSGNKVVTSVNQEIVAELLQLKNEYSSGNWDTLTAETLFGSTNYFHFLPREQRGEMIFLLDVGWNASFWAKTDTKKLMEVDPDPEKFGSLGDTPLKRLRTMVARVKEYGYGGLGLSLWIPNSAVNDVTALPLWEENARRCRQAGVTLLHISYTFEWDDRYLQAVTDAMGRLAPDTRLELSTPWQRYLSRADSDAIADRQRQIRRLLPICDGLAITDAFDTFATVSALRNADLALSCGAVPENGRQGILCFNGQAYVAAVLGGTVAIPRQTRETEAALGWHRLAPPFAVHEATYRHAEDYLMDAHFFYRNVERPQLEGYTLRHTAPAVMARGCPLPTVTVSEGHVPYIAASRNPRTGAYALGAFQRNIPPNYAVWGLADVTLEVDSTAVPVGLFGLFRSVTLVYPHPLGEVRVTVQDPAGYVALMNVTDQVTVEGNTLRLDGEKLGYWGKIGWDDDYKESPALILRVDEIQK